MMNEEEVAKTSGGWKEGRGGQECLLLSVVQGGG